MLVGCGTTKVDPNASVKLITDPIIEKKVRNFLRKRTGELTNADLAKVTNVDLRNWSQITDEGLKDVAKLQNLTHLQFYRTKITDAGLKELAKLQKLTHLELNGSQQAFTDAGLKELAKLQNLTNLNLQHATQITDTGLKEVAKLQNLTHLNLRSTKITDEGLKEVAKLQQLIHLNLISAHVTEAGVAELKKALPKCSIFGP